MCCLYVRAQAGEARADSAAAADGPARRARERGAVRERGGHGQQPQRARHLCLHAPRLHGQLPVPLPPRLSHLRLHRSTCLPPLLHPHAMSTSGRGLARHPSFPCVPVCSARDRMALLPVSCTAVMHYLPILAVKGCVCRRLFWGRASPAAGHIWQEGIPERFLMCTVLPSEGGWRVAAGKVTVGGLSVQQMS